MEPEQDTFEANHLNFVFVVLSNFFPGYWGKGKTLDEAIANFKQAGGKWSLGKVVAYLVLGDKMDYDSIGVDEMAQLHRPKDSSSHRILGKDG